VTVVFVAATVVRDEGAGLEHAEKSVVSRRARWRITASGRWSIRNRPAERTDPSTRRRSPLGTAGLPGCNGTVVDSADKCQANFDYTCPFKGIGTIRFVGAGGQTSETTISASETIYIVTNVGTCTSTYSVAITRI